MTERPPGSIGEGRKLTWIFVLVFACSSLLLAYSNGMFSGEAGEKPGQGVASVTKNAPAPSQKTVAVILEQLDAAFNAGDLASYLALFKPLHSMGQDLLARRLAPVLAGKTVSRQSEIVSFRQVGDRAIALISTRVRQNSDPEGTSSEEAAFLVCSRSGESNFALFQVEVDENHLGSLIDQTEPGTFSCLACNYRIQARQDWLLVPHSNLRVGCLESISFYSLYYDLSIDLSVHVQEEAVAAAKTLADLSAEQNASELRPWLPPAYRDGRMVPPVGLSGAQVDVNHGDDRCSLLRLAAYGPIQYLMAVQGPASVINERMRAIENVLSSFELIDPIFSPGYVPGPDRPSHLIGKLEGPEFVGELVQFSGPAGWKSSRSPDWSRFQIIYSCPDSEAYVRFKGLPPPKGTDSWTQDAADLMVSSSIESSGMRILDDGGWEDGSELSMSGWPEVRALELGGDIAGKPSRRALRLVLDAEILVLIEANDAEDQASKLIDASCASLKHR